jgi:signal transduction histidine kinase
MARPRPVAWLRSHPFAADALLAALLAVMSVIVHLTLREGDFEREVADPSVWGVLLCILATAPLAWRRRSPVVVLVVVCAAQAALEANSMIGPGWIGIVIAAYTVGSQLSGRKLWVTGVSLLVGATGFVLLGVIVADVNWQALLTNPVIISAALLLGDNMRRRRERQAELLERAERAERERELLAQQRVQHERTRIARELHDVVAHSLSVMVIQAAAARRTADPEAARAAMETVETTGRKAMTEMRRVLGVLRDDEGQHSELAPIPTLDDLQQLIGEANDLPVRFDTQDLSELPAGVELSVYRIVQEGLTNVRRHAGPVDHVDVAVRRDNGSVVVEIADDGHGASAAPNAEGLGLTGMRERVALHDGTLSAGPRQGGGWRVRAVIPVGA